MNLFINKFSELKSMIENEDIPGMRKMMQDSTYKRSLFDKKYQLLILFKKMCKNVKKFIFPIFICHIIHSYFNRR